MQATQSTLTQINMTSSEIKSERVRNIITGSATPAMDICALTLTPAELVEVKEYFTYAGGLFSCASQESDFMITNGI